MSRLMNGFVNVTERTYFEGLLEAERRNKRLQALGIYQTLIEFKKTSISRWKWVLTLPDTYRENPLFIENIENELRQEAIEMFSKQKEMGMDELHLQILWDKLTE